MKKIFISYVHIDATDLATSLRKYLIDEYDVFLDKENLAGTRFSDEIKNEINNCDYFIPIITRKFVNPNRYVKREAEQAISENKPIFPCLDDKFDVNVRDLPYGLNRYSVINFETHGELNRAMGHALNLYKKTKENKASFTLGTLGEIIRRILTDDEFECRTFKLVKKRTRLDETKLKEILRDIDATRCKPYGKYEEFWGIFEHEEKKILSDRGFKNIRFTTLDDYFPDIKSDDLRERLLSIGALSKDSNRSGELWYLAH